MAGSEGRVRRWHRFLADKSRGDAMVARLQALGIVEVNPDCGERRRAY
ncbi:hypothetical protein [Propioniciclava sinopodophylli]|nr:hypothetical protein [Propioniciclava sinopodophylli]